MRTYGNMMEWEHDRMGSGNGTAPTWPWLKNMASTTPSTELSRSAESNTMNGDFPPSSSDIFFPDPAMALRSF